MNSIDKIGNIESIRAIEDSIRATKKYTEGLLTLEKKHPQMIQGEDFPSRVFCKHYEVYPELEISWDMPVGTAVDMMWGDTTIINIIFKYDYRINKASISIKIGDSKLIQKSFRTGIYYFLFLFAFFNFLI